MTRPGTDHHWQFGNRVNPGGQATRSLERIARTFLQAQDDARDALPGQTRTSRLLAMLYAVATGDGYKTSDRLSAAKMLFERAFGAPRAVVEIAPPPVDDFVDVGTLDDAQLREIEAADALVLGAGIVVRGALPTPEE